MAAESIEALLSLLCLPVIVLMSVLLLGVYCIFKPITSCLELMTEWYFEGNLDLCTGFDSFYFNEKHNSSDTIILAIFMNKIVDLDESEGILKHMLLTARNAKGRRIASNMQTITIAKWGYVFRKKAPNFVIDNHFVRTEKILKDKKDFEEALIEETRLSWIEDSPKWIVKTFAVEKCIFPTSNSSCDEQNLILVKICHSLTDGISLARTILTLLEMYKKSGPQIDVGKEKLTFAYDIWKFLYNMVFYFPLEMVKFLVLPDNKYFRSSGETSDVKFSFLDPIPLDRVKAIAKATRTTLFDVYISCFAASLHRYISQNGGNTCRDVFIMFPYSYQRQKHPVELNNNISCIPMWIPVAKMPSLQRLLNVAQRTDALKNSPLLFGIVFLNWFTGLLPIAVRMMLKRMTTPSFFMSPVPLFKVPIKYFHDEVVHQIYPNFIQHYGNGIIFILQYNNYALVSMTFNSNSIKRKEDGDLLLQFFKEELMYLEAELQKLRMKNIE